MFLFMRDGKLHLQYHDPFDGRIRRISTRTADKNKALKFVSEFRTKLYKKKIVAVSLGKFMEDYLDYIKNTKSLKYYKSIKFSFNELERKFDANISIKKINSLEMEKFLIGIYGRSKYSAHMHFRNLKKAFNKAIDWNLLEANPLARVKISRPPKKIPLFISVDEFNNILDQEPNKQYRNFYIFALHTGMRLNEITHLQWEHVDLLNHELVVKNTETFSTKNKLDRKIPLNDTCMELLNSIKPNQMSSKFKNYVFSKVIGVPLHGETVSRFFKFAVLAADVNPKYHFHVLRHSFASRLVQKGVSIYHVSKLLGHSDVTTTQIYAHLRNDDLHSAVKTLDLN